MAKIKKIALVLALFFAGCASSHIARVAVFERWLAAGTPT